MVPYLIAKPDFLAVLLWSTIRFYYYYGLLLDNFSDSVFIVDVTKIQM